MTSTWESVGKATPQVKWSGLTVRGCDTLEAAVESDLGSCRLAQRPGLEADALRLSRQGGHRAQWVTADPAGFRRTRVPVER